MSRGCAIVFPEDGNERAVEQEKQAEIPLEETLEWPRALGARAAALPQAVGGSWDTVGPTDTRRVESGQQQTCGVAILCSLKEGAIELRKIGFVERREQFRRKSALRKLKASTERENEERRESNCELWLIHKHLTSTWRLSIEGADGGTYCMSLWENYKQVMRVRTSLKCLEMDVLACVNRRCRFGHTSSQLMSKQGKASLSVFFGRQSKRRGSMRTCFDQGRECSMRLVDGVKRILCLGGGSRVGGPLLSGSKSVVIPSSIEVLCRSYVAKYGSIESLTFEAGSHFQRIEKSTFSESELKSIVIPSSVKVFDKSCFVRCKLLSSIPFESDSHPQRIEKCAFAWSRLNSVTIPLSVEVLCIFCFGSCESLSSIPFESDRSNLAERDSDLSIVHNLGLISKRLIPVRLLDKSSPNRRIDSHPLADSLEKWYDTSQNCVHRHTEFRDILNHCVCDGLRVRLSCGWING
jgi:hypothetical protein